MVAVRTAAIASLAEATVRRVATTAHRVATAPLAATTALRVAEAAVVRTEVAAATPAAATVIASRAEFDRNHGPDFLSGPWRIETKALEAKLRIARFFRGSEL